MLASIFWAVATGLVLLTLLIEFVEFFDDRTGLGNVSVAIAILFVAIWFAVGIIGIF